MKYYLTLLVILISGAALEAQEPLHQKIYFSNSRMDGSYFYSAASYSAPSWIKRVREKLPVADSIWFTPGNSLELNYVSAKNGKWQAEIRHHKIRGADHFKPYDQLVMRLFVQSATTAGQLPEIALADVDGKNESNKFVSIHQYLDSFSPGRWMTLKIPVKDLQQAGGSVSKADRLIFRQAGSDGREHRIFIDQVELAADNNSGITAKPVMATARGYAKHVDLQWSRITDSAVKHINIYRSGDGSKYHAVGIQSPYISRYMDYTDTTGKEYHYKISLVDHQYRESGLSEAVSASTAPMSDSQLLDMVQEACFRYYWEGAEQTSGLALENIHGRRNMIATGASGFGLMALIAGAERKFITAQQLSERFEKILGFLEKADRFHGVYPHFLDGKTGKTEAFFGRRDNGADLVETSFLAQGLLAARQYFNRGGAKEKLIADRITKIWQEIEWDWFRREKDSKFLYWHWSPDQAWVIDHRLIGWNETMITYVLAICSPSHAVPASLYYSGWASQEKVAQDYRSGWGQTRDGSKYTNGNTYSGIPLPVGVSNGGPLFFVHYSFLGLDPHRMKDAYTDYFSNNRNIAMINYRYCVENPEKHQGYGPAAWGLTASDGLWSYQADEPVPHNDHGKITPTGALASFPYTPGESMAALKNYYYNYGKFAWGEYGFYDAFSLEENWCSEIFMGLNQGPIAVMIENYRSGLLWNLFMENKEIRQGLKKIESMK